MPWRFVVFNNRTQVYDTNWKLGNDSWLCSFVMLYPPPPPPTHTHTCYLQTSYSSISEKECIGDLKHQDLETVFIVQIENQATHCQLFLLFIRFPAHSHVAQSSITRGHTWKRPGRAGVVGVIPGTHSRISDRHFVFFPFRVLLSPLWNMSGSRMVMFTEWPDLRRKKYVSPDKALDRN